MVPQSIQAEKGNILRELHHKADLLVLPNIWDPLGAALLEKAGYPAVATGSASVALSHGYPDGENIPFSDLLQILARIVRGVTVPVTADIEKGYAKNNTTLRENMKALLGTGIAGINFEDGHPSGRGLIPIDLQCEKISLIRKTAKESGIPLFINARTDVYISGEDFPAAEKLTETIRRGRAYREAGADGFYPITVTDRSTLGKIIAEVDLPLNVLLLPGIPGFSELKEMGVARLSLGSGYLHTALRVMKDVAEKLLNHEGMEEITRNPVTSHYVKNLINYPPHEKDQY